MSDRSPAMDAGRPGAFARLPRRIYLTLKYEGPRGLMRRAARFPRRFGPEARRLGLAPEIIERRRRARDWHAAHGRPATVVSVNAEQELGEAVAGAGSPEDLVLVGAGVTPEPAWLACLQHAAHAGGAGIVAARVLSADGAIQSAGLERESSTTRLRSRLAGVPAHYGPADVPVSVLGGSQACLYVRRDVVERIGPPGPRALVGRPDADWCLRAWEAGFEVAYEPAAIVRAPALPADAAHAANSAAPAEAAAPADPAGEARWRPFWADRAVGAGDRLRIVYVTEGTGIWGGHRLIFEAINRLHDRGHDVSLFTLEPRPEWFPLRAPVRTFGDYGELTAALAPLEAIKVATWWKTSAPVWRAAVTAGLPVYLVQDIETSYYPEAPSLRHQVLASYRSEFHYLTISRWNRDRLRELGLEATLFLPGLDLRIFRPLELPREKDTVLAIGRSNPLKRFDLTIEAWRRLEAPRPRLRVFGSEPELVPRGAEFVASPTDAQVNEELNRCAVFVQTSTHEGFCLPPLEAMAAGAPVVCTDADGNRDYCVDGVNCLMPGPDPADIAQSIRRLLEDPELRTRIAQAGLATAREYDQERRAVELEAFFTALARAPARP